uniref:Uncharacterized protein n=1 Tax=Ditylenchus dipsaci TaxID=166011 RepID=A0A915E8Y0_9BILA
MKYYLIFVLIFFCILLLSYQPECSANQTGSEKSHWKIQKDLFWEDLHIYNDQGVEVYQTDAYVFSFTKLFTLLDSKTKQEIGLVEKEFWSWMPTYFIYLRGVKYAEFKKEFRAFALEFSMNTADNSTSLTVKRDWLWQDFEFSRHGKSVANMTTKVFSWRREYDVEIAKGEDELLILTCCALLNTYVEDNSRKD